MERYGNAGKGLHGSMVSSVESKEASHILVFFFNSGHVLTAATFSGSVFTLSLLTTCPTLFGVQF